MGVRIRQLGVDDDALAVEVVRLVKASGNPPLDRSEMRRWLSDSSHILIAATVDGSPVGFALGYMLARVDTARPMLFFYEIEVSASHRRHGIGRGMVEAMKAVARERNVLKMWVQTSPDNEAARALYRSAGACESAGCDLLYVWTDPAGAGGERPSDGS